MGTSTGGNSRRKSEENDDDDIPELLAGIAAPGNTAICCKRYLWRSGLLLPDTSRASSGNPWRCKVPLRQFQIQPHIAIDSKVPLIGC
jgi:hypothetical protein